MGKIEVAEDTFANSKAVFRRRLELPKEQALEEEQCPELDGDSGTSRVRSVLAGEFVLELTPEQIAFLSGPAEAPAE